MDCESVRNQFADHLAGELPEEPGPFQRHLEACAECRDEFNSLQSLWARMQGVVVEPPDSFAMRSRFGQLLQASAKSPVRLGAGAWRLRPAFQFALALAVFGLGIVIGQRLGLTTTPESLPEVTELRSELRETREMVLSLMQRQSASDRLRGVNWSNQIGQPDNPVLAALLYTLQNDPNVNVRVASVSALEKFGQQEIVRQGLLEALGNQKNPLVQAALIDVVVVLRQTESVDILEKMADDSEVHESVRKQARWALEQLS
jgi:hypothetical protein